MDFSDNLHCQNSVSSVPLLVWTVAARRRHKNATISLSLNSNITYIKVLITKVLKHLGVVAQAIRNRVGSPPTSWRRSLWTTGRQPRLLTPTLRQILLRSIRSLSGRLIEKDSRTYIWLRTRSSQK
jgi:hypothetical protein